MNFFLALVIASIAAVAMGLVAQRMFRNAATRHAVLLASLLLPPVLAIAAVAGLRLPAASAVTMDVIVEAAAPVAIAPSRDANLTTLVVALWLAGVAIGVVRIVIHLLRWRAVARRAEVVNGLTRSSEVREPTVIGIVNPVIVLPAAYDFTAEELEAVFAHEVAHIARHDNLTALLVQLVCAAFWFDPLHRVARRKLVELRERVVDDLVLDDGCDPEAYVSALARSCEPSFHQPAVACMSRLNLHERMNSIMTHETRRRWPASITRILVAAAIAIAAIGFSTFAPAPSLIAGDTTASAYDFDVRAMPHPDGRYTLTVRIDAPEGPFSSVAVVSSAPDSRTVSTTHAGKTYQVAVSLAKDGSATATLNVTAGTSVLATKTKSFERQMVPPPPPPAPPKSSDNMTRPRPIQRVEPHYPDEAKQKRIAGVTIIEASIDETGNVTGTRIVKPLSHGLDQAAVEAVSQWKFEPATLDGKPVAAQLTITFNFRPE